MNYNEALKQVNEHIISFFTQKMDARVLYHNHTHTWELVDTVNKIASKLSLDDHDRFIVLTAAWFYDTGYFVNTTSDYETKSAEAAESFLNSIGADNAITAEVKKAIIVTKMPQQPTTIAEKIICDAVMYYLGTEEFAAKNKLLRRETEAISATKIAGEDWRKRSIALMEVQHYFTEYCQLRLNKKKIENINKLKLKQENQLIAGLQDIVPVQKGEAAGEKGSDETALSILHHPNSDGETGEKMKKTSRKKSERPGRGIETLFRTSSTNHQRLSAMADNKAHILISVNSIIISAVLALVIRNLEAVPYLMFPTVMLLIVSVVTIIFSILATRPKVPNGYFTREQVEKKDIDLSFFGNFYKMEFTDYDSSMKKLMKDSDFLYGSLIRNLYGQAKVLGRKFKLLRISYDIFMFGLVITVLTYIILLVLNK